MFPTANTTTTTSRRFSTAAFRIHKRIAAVTGQQPRSLRPWVARQQYFSGDHRNFFPTSHSRQSILSIPIIDHHHHHHHCKGTRDGIVADSFGGGGGDRRTFASLTEKSETIIQKTKKRLDEFQDLFVEARMSIEDVVESQGTKYFDEDAETAQQDVDKAVKAFEQLVSDIADPDEKNRVLRGNGLKVEQLKGELDLALKEGHDH